MYLLLRLKPPSVRELHERERRPMQSLHSCLIFRSYHRYNHEHANLSSLSFFLSIFLSRKQQSIVKFRDVEMLKCWHCYYNVIFSLIDFFWVSKRRVLACRVQSQNRLKISKSFEYFAIRQKSKKKSTRLKIVEDVREY